MMQSVLTALPSLPGSCDVTPRQITVVDLLPLLRTGRAAEPELVTKIVLPRGQPISKLSFSSDGMRLAVSLKDGHTIRVYDVRPTSMVVRRVLTGPQGGPYPGYADDLRSIIHAGLHSGQVAPVHVYDLQRGRSSAVIENISWNNDMRWVAIGSRRRTVHVFPVNPYGGRPDDISHLEGRVKNPTELVSLPKKPVSSCALTHLLATTSYRDQTLGAVLRVQEPATRPPACPSFVYVYQVHGIDHTNEPLAASYRLR